jgi:NAD(P)-dependent dehydrogenase (short-subunit alcohol dehydrogenase family)
MAFESLKIPSIRAAAMATTPMKKIARPEDITGMIAFLSSWNLSGHITGEVIMMYIHIQIRVDSSTGGMEGRQLNDAHEIE